MREVRCCPVTWVYVQTCDCKGEILLKKLALLYVWTLLLSILKHLNVAVTNSLCVLGFYVHESSQRYQHSSLSCNFPTAGSIALCSS